MPTPDAAAPALTAAERKRIADLVLRAARDIAAAEDDPADADSLAGILYHAWVTAYEASLKDAGARAGGAEAVVRLNDADVLAHIQQHAEQTAKGILRTFERDLLRYVHGLPDDTDPAEIPRLVARWNLERDMWKQAQIALTETARAAGAAQKEFIKRTKAKGKAWFGNSLKCPICQDVAADNPHDLDDTLVGAVMHPGELDWWRIEYEATDGVWTGD